jgi:hypothetical protein
MKESKRVLFYHFMTTYVQVIVIMWNKAGFICSNFNYTTLARIMTMSNWPREEQNFACMRLVCRLAGGGDVDVNGRLLWEKLHTAPIRARQSRLSCRLMS